MHALMGMVLLEEVTEACINSVVLGRYELHELIMLLQKAAYS